MINLHRYDPRGFKPYCFVCGNEITEDDTCISYQGLKCGRGRSRNTIWMHRHCVDNLLTYLQCDILTSDRMDPQIHVKRG